MKIRAIPGNRCAAGWCFEPENPGRSITCCQNTTPDAERAGTSGSRVPLGAQLACDPPACIAPPRLDGHTRARLTFPPKLLALAAAGDVAGREFAALVAELRRPRTRDEEKRERRERLLVRRLPTGEHAECTVGGTRRHILKFHVYGQVHITINCEEGDAKIQWKAHGLWALETQSEALARWIVTVHAWLTGEVIAFGDCYACGWHMTGLEICADFTGLRWRRSDVEGFIGRYTRGTQDQLRTRRGDRLTSYVGVDGEVQTINVGSRKSNVSWCLYDKTLQIDQAKGGSNLPTYLSTWIRYGWNETDEVARVELRLTSRGLRFELDGGEVLNLRDPAQVTARAVRIAWTHCAGKYRLVDRTTSTRAERCKLDPRWELVTAAAGLEAVDAKQKRTVSEDAHAERVSRSARSVAMGLRRLASLHGCAVTTPDGLELLVHLAEHHAKKHVALTEYAAAYSKAIAELVPRSQLEAAAELLARISNGDVTGLAETLDA